MPVKVKFIAAIITGMLLAIPGSVIAQDSQNAPSAQGQMQVPDQAPAPDPMQDQGVPQDQDQGVMQDQDQDQPPAPSGHGSAQQQDENQRPPMTELPPPPSKPSPNIQGPYGSGPQNPNYPDPNYGNPPYGNPPYNRGYGSGSYGKSGSGNSNESSSNNGVGRVSLIHGDVSTQRGDSGDWSAAVLNAPLMTGDKVSTGDKARAEIQLDYANVLRLSEHTQANITNLTRSQIQIQLGHGMANYTVLGKSDAEAEIDTPNVAIRTERQAASFRILVTADDHTEVLVRQGEVEITTPQGGTRVGANQFITIRGTGDQTQYRIGEAPARDDWDQWNTDRDRMIDNSASRKHTNDYYVGSQDLDNNGSWRDVPDYGQAWFPNEGADWAPYRAGNWVWEPYWGWTWVSYEPWGWAPYHYGRWFQYGGAWGWWPGPVYGYPYYRPLWAPAYVSFFGFGGGFGVGFGWGSIGWFPIGPCDFFHPWWGGFGGRFGYTGFGGWNRGGFAPLHGGNRFSNVRLAQNDSHFRGATSVSGGEFGRAGAHFQPVSHGAMQNARFATGNLPVTPTRANLSASGRPAAASTLGNRGGSQHFFSTHGTTTANTHSFAREQAQVSNAMRQSGVAPINGNRGTENRNSGFQSRNNSVRAEPGARTFNQSSDGGRSNMDARGNFNFGSTRPGSSANSSPAHESGPANSGGWQKFSPMAPRSSAEQPAGRSSGGAGEARRGSYGSSRGASGYSGSQGRMSEGRGYGGSRPPLNMRQPIVTPRSYGGSPYGGRSYGGRSAPGYGGGRSAPSFGGHSGGSSHGGGGGHSGGGGHGGHR